jgi:peptidoglycan hydrolase-like protein with peptidoglycan-binding domain
VRNRSRNTDETDTLGGLIRSYPRESVGILMAAAATLAIFANAMFLQHGPHPAPLFSPQLLTQREAALPPRRPLAAQTPSAPASARSQAQIILDIQRELASRGYYDGAIDGIWGAKTAAAARAFAQAAGLKTTPEPSESLLRSLAESATKTAVVAPAVGAPAVARNDPNATVIGPSKRMLAVQNALADFGYGQIKPTGIYDQDTRAAIEAFQRDRNLPVDGQVSDRFVRNLADMTGRQFSE